MGRSRSNALQKSATPIPFPHDGPIHHGLLKHICSDSTPGITMASELLASESDSPSFRLCRALQSARSTKEQLQNFQSYRNSLLNTRNKGNDASSPLVEEDRTRPSSTNIIGLYRLLLEWSLSFMTPVPLQRAIQSTLKIMIQDIPDDDKFVIQSIQKDVLASLWKQPECWKNNLHSLEVAVNYAPLACLLQEALLPDCLSFLYQTKVARYLSGGPNEPLSNNQDVALGIVGILKVVLNSPRSTSDDHYRPLPFLRDLQQFVLRFLDYKNLPTDGIITLGIVYGMLLLHVGDANNIPLADIVVTAVETLDSVHSTLSPLSRLVMVQGIAATLDLPTLISTKSPSRSSISTCSSPLESCWRYSLKVSKEATDPMVRWGALKGLSTLAIRWQQQEQISIRCHDELIQETLQVVLQAWENPPLRKLGTAIPGLFKTLVKLLGVQQIDELCRHVIGQPVNRKGRYLALEILLPYMDASMISPLSLLDGIGDRGGNTGPIADLWSKLLGKFWKEHDAIPEASPQHNISVYVETWMSSWVPSLANALVAPKDLSRRKQVSAFCFPRIVDLMKSSDFLRPHLPNAFIALFDETASLRKKTNSKGALDSYSAESIGDRGLWAQLEISRNTTMHKIMSPALQQVIASNLPTETLHMALTHASASIRLVAFQSLESVIAAYSQTSSIESEADMWQYAFPYAMKSTTESKEYISSLLQCLSCFLDRFSVWEASKVSKKSEAPLPKLHSFLSDFLINSLVVKKGVYPSVPEKELFTLALVELVLSFVTQDQSFVSDSCVVRNGIVFNRQRLPEEIITMENIARCLLHRELFAALFALLHSPWDNTRAGAFRCLSKLVILAQAKNIQLPTEYSASDERSALEARGVYLASSPRQREADTGARILAYLYISLDSETDRDLYLGILVDLLQSRLLSMKEELQCILKGTGERGDGGGLPLAHGIIHSVRLAVEHRRILKRHRANVASSMSSSIFERMMRVFCQGIQVSLAVVADVREGEMVEGMDDEIAFNEKTPLEGASSRSTPLNVNTGAIGANGVISSISTTDELEAKARLIMQRIVVGSWLLTKETCAAISTTITMCGFEPQYSLLEKVGVLLISTLTSLKHAGAAFASRDTLQSVASMCMSSNCKNISALPELWANRLLEEISLDEKVRDSTLRRSTGYALGFLAIMRSEISSKYGSTKLICRNTLESILSFSLPPEDQVKFAFENLKISGAIAAKPSELFYTSSFGRRRIFIPDSKYEARCRVHALNVLRLIILDAPLASVVTPFIGDAILSAVLGYNDPSWAVRNSATMVFSAAMLRVVDADKNASNTDRTSSTAITITELFRRYPPLSSFLPSVMQNSLASSSGSGQADSQLFAILLLLARVQPIADSAGVSTILIEPFIALVLRCIGSSHHAIREAAARSLANLCSEDQPVHSSSFLLMEQCKRLLEESLAKSNWNSVDGALLAIDTLVKTSEASKKAFRDLNVESNLFNIVALDKATMLRPPCCLATSIEILATVSNENERDKMEKILFSACKQVVAYRDLDKDIGGAKLLGTASRYLCRSLQARLWRPENEEDLKMCLGDMGSLLTCSVIDVRLSAAKSFKKGIYSNIDQLLACNEPSGDRALNRSKILSSVAFLLLKSLQTEIERGKQQVEKAAVHIPTVRRISRCLLECFYGLLALEDGSATLFSDSLEATGGTSLWSTAVSMTNLESFLDDTPLESNGETFLSSNAAELMGITIAHRLTEGLSNNNTEFRDKLHVFLKVVNRLNHPKSSWRSRHSAVISLETSQILNTNLEVDNYCRGLQKNALFEVLGMLQDSDPDVRAVAVRAAGQFGNSEESSKNLFRSLLPELMLQNTFPKVYVVARSGDTVRHDEQAEIVDALLKSILSNCGNILETMQKIEEELLHTCETSAPASSLLNKTTTRKIFEEEDPNPSNERMLANQLATRSLLKMKDWPQGCLTLSNELFLVCSSCLEIVARNIRVGGIAHEITRFPTIFPGLHGIICGASVALHLGVEDVHGIKESARKIVEMGRSFDCSNLFHPDVLKALESLAKADTTTESEIAKDAFLLDNL